MVLKYFCVNFIWTCILLFVIQGFYINSGNLVGVVIGDILMTILFKLRLKYRELIN